MKEIGGQGLMLSAKVVWAISCRKKLVSLLSQLGFLQVGTSSSGKSSLVRLLADLTGHQLLVLPMSSAMDTTELLGGFEQVTCDFFHFCCLFLWFEYCCLFLSPIAQSYVYFGVYMQVGLRVNLSRDHKFSHSCCLVWNHPVDFVDNIHH